MKHWLPELEPLPPEHAQFPWRPSECELAAYGVRLGVDYPSPVVGIDERYDEMR